MVRKYGDIISGGGIIFASIFIFIATFSFKRLTVSRIGPSFVPQIHGRWSGCYWIVDPDKWN